MCNLYSMNRSQEALRRLFHIRRDASGNVPALPAIHPDAMAPVVRADRNGGRELIQMRWGFPPPPKFGGPPVTNVRNAASPYWRPWLERDFRCLVPATSFCEWNDGRPKIPHWFALAEERPLFAFAGIWRPWTGARGPKSAPAEGEHLLFSILTTEANEIVRPIHAKAMPVMLTTEAEWRAWLEAPVADALALQRPLPAGALSIVATGRREDAESASEAEAPLFAFFSVRSD